MNLNQLRFVRAVADAGSFTGAAQRCYVTQSTLSTGVAMLERELGERLFMRTTRSVSLTPFGRRLLPLVDNLLRAQEALLEAAGDYLDTEIKPARVGVCPLVDAVRLEMILAPYREANRNVKVVLEQLSGVEAGAALAEGRFDFIVGPMEARRPRLERAKLYEDVLIYLRSGDVGPFPGDRQPVRVDEIAGDQLLLVHDSCGLTRLTRHLFRARHLPLWEYEGQAVSYQVLEEWARAGIGSAILPQSKLSSTDIGRPIVLGNGQPALLRFEGVWSSTVAQAPHVLALAQHFKRAGATLPVSHALSSQAPA
jgi:LysR family hydrogen peroxide-inducible transcriptional activator